jgi:sugar phosphate permease
VTATPVVDGIEKVDAKHYETNAYADNGSDHEKGDTHSEEGIQKDIDAGIDPDYLKRLQRKIDWRLIPVLSLMYAISLIDRTNLAIARAANNNQMNKELALDINGGDNNRYSIITLVFFVPYIIFEIPSQIGLRKFGARIWLGSAVLLWGVVMLSMGWANNWSALAAQRAILGLFESALFPGAAYLISCWYPRKDIGVRTSIFYISAAVAGSFAKPLGYCFSLLDGKQGLTGWRWLFIFYGALTIVIAIIGYIFIIDFPDKAAYLDEEEKRIVALRIQRDRADAKPDPLTAAKVGRYMLLWQPWLFALMFMSTTTATYSLAYFLPTILTQMGFNNIESMMLGTPAYFWAIIPAVVCGKIADKYRGTRAFMVMINAACILIGTCMYAKLPIAQKNARFAGIFFAVGGGNSNVPLIISWQATAIRSQSKRGYVSALSVAFGGIGGILGSALFFNKEAKKGYPTGINVTLGLNAFTFACAGCLYLYMRMMNRKADKGEVVIEDNEDFRYQP